MDNTPQTIRQFINKHPGWTALIILVVVGFIQGTISSSNKVPVAQVQSAQIKAVEKQDIRVLSQAVKYVDGKYRYFFDIRNHDKKLFQGKVTIELLLQNGSVIGRDVFVATKPTEPGYGDSVYFDIRTGPVPDFQPEYAVTSFHFTATSNEGLVAEGSGRIEGPAKE
jgi:hypothetical protein